MNCSYFKLYEDIGYDLFYMATFITIDINISIILQIVFVMFSWAQMKRKGHLTRKLSGCMPKKSYVTQHAKITSYAMYN